MNARCLEPPGGTTSEFTAQAPATGDASQPVHAAISALWQRLLTGELVVAETTMTNDAVMLSLRRWATPLRLAVPAESSRAFETVVRGQSQKVVAIDLELSASSVSGKLQQVVTGMGLRCNPTRIPLGVALLAHAAERPELIAGYWEGERIQDGPPTYVVMLKRCDAVLAGKLSKSEFDVVRRLLEGCTYRVIARDRVTSVRTIANQASAIFRKVGVSGRFGLLRSVIESTFRTPNTTWRAPVSDALLRIQASRPVLHGGADAPLVSNPALDRTASSF
jgi:DNA-binding CsgD family transcriptional regulator